MNTPTQSTRLVRRMASVVLASCLLFAPSLLPAQVAPRAEGQSDAPGKKPAGSVPEVMELSPFEVRASSDDSYGALNSNSVTAFNTELFKLPLAADIYDQAFMRDVGSRDAESMIQDFTAGAGITGPDPSLNAGFNQPGDRNRVAFIQLRGLTTGTPKRDTLMPVGNVNQPGSTAIGYTSNFDLERVEVISGPQGLLYGNSGAGGVINYVSKQAKFGKPLYGSIEVSTDSYGGVMGVFDLGFSTKNVAVRVAALEQELKTRRTFLGGPIHGIYGQVAIRAFGNTTLKFMAEQTTYDKTKSINYTLNAGSTKADARHGARFDYLLATNQVMQSATGPSEAGPLLNGNLNWENVNSLGGSWAKDKTTNSFYTFSAETKWNDWLSTKLDAGYVEYYNDYYANTATIYAPNVAANPLPGQWTYAQTGADPAHDSFQTNRDAAFRFLALAKNSFFDGKAQSQTAVGADYLNVHLTNINWGLYLLDANGNPVVNPAVTTRDGRSPIPAVYWSIDNGPVKHGPWVPNAANVTWKGNNYLRMVQNEIRLDRATEDNPIGTRLGGETSELGKVLEKGVFVTNYTQWYDNKVNSMVGFRLQDSFYKYSNSGRPPGNVSLTKGTTFNYNVGADFELLDTVRPYFTVSSSFLKPPNMFVDPNGESPELQHAVGAELGVKFQNHARTVSATLSVYHADSKNEQQEVSGALGSDINPAGLNGSYRGRRGVHYTTNRESDGVQFTLTAAPTRNWRMRLSAAWANGRVKKEAVFDQFYNDQFYQNAQGQVTYADGSVVYVPATFTPSALTVSASTPGAAPLTIDMLSTPGSQYYASPQDVTGQITSGSNGGRVLRVVSPTNGAILTGATGLPMSMLQINPTLAGIAGTIPGQIVVNQAGDVTSGYPEYSLNLTNNYTFRSGWLKGFDIGGAVIATWRVRGYYYYPDNYTGPGSKRELLYTPDRLTFNPWIGYSHKFRKFDWRVRVNIDNVFNRYELVYLPHAVTGYTSRNAIGTTFYQQPRSYQVSTTFSF